MWMQHLFSLLGVAATNFIEAIGTTFLGLILGIVCALATAIATLKRIRHERGVEAMRDHWKTNARVTLCVSFWCILVVYAPIGVFKLAQAVYEDHQGLVGRSHAQRSEIREDVITLQKTKDSCLQSDNELRVQRAGVLGENKTLQNQNRDQQQTINNCQDNAIKLLAPPKKELTMYTLESGPDQANGTTKAKVLILSNVPVSPVHLLIRCKHPILDVTYSIVGRSDILGDGSIRLSSTDYQVAFSSPVLGPKAPLYITLTQKSDGASSLICTFNFN